jgi:adenine C2-methylase RlmN of 23S rRNA A2503 and tRNA A37
LTEKVAAQVKKTEITAVGIRHDDHVAPLYPQELTLTSPTSGGCSVGIVVSRTQAAEFSLVLTVSKIVKQWALLVSIP